MSILKENMGYTAIALKGLSWVGIFRLFLRLTAFIRTAILARILTPAQFGIYGMAAVVLGLLEMLTETGINVFLIQEEEDSVLTYLNTAYVVSIIRGAIVAVIVFISAPLISAFFQTPEAYPLIAAIAVVPLIRGFINPSVINFQKNLHFKADFMFRAGIIFSEASIAIAAAVITRSPFSLVLAMIGSSIVEVILSHTIIKPTPKILLVKNQFNTIISRGKWVTGAGIFAFLSSKTPDTVIGRLLNPASLGQYQMSFRFSALLIEEVNETFNRVAFPIYTKIQTDRHRLKKAFLKNYAAVLSISFPLLVIIWLFPEPITRIALGDQWLEVIPLMRHMAWVGLAIALAAPTNPLFLAAKKQNYLSFSTSFQFLVLIAVIFPLISNLGLVGVITAYAISIMATVPLRTFLAYKILAATNKKILPT
jgi:lipopolysaccharide exporter